MLTCPVCRAEPARTGNVNTFRCPCGRLLVTPTETSFEVARQTGLRLTLAGDGTVLFSGPYANQSVIPTADRDKVVRQAVRDAIVDEVMVA